MYHKKTETWWVMLLLQQMPFWVVITEKLCPGILFFPFYQLFSSTVTAVVEKNKILFFASLCNMSALITKLLLRMLTQTKPSEVLFFGISK